MARQVDLNRVNASVANNPNNTISSASLQNIIGSSVPPGLTLAYLEQVINNLLAQIDQVTGLDLLTFAKALEALFSDTDNPLGAFVTLISNIASALQGIDLSNPGAVLTAIGEAITEFLSNITQDLFGVIGGDLASLGSNLMALLGFPVLNLPPIDFDAIEAAYPMLRDVLTPAGAVTSSTQIPPHLYAALNIGNASSNLFPDGSFDDAGSLDGQGLYTWSSGGRLKPGSAWTVASGVLLPLIGVAIGTAPGDITNLSTYANWNGVTATTGNAIVLAANAYSDDDATMLISDPDNRVIAAITDPGTTSVGYTGADDEGWVPLSGMYQAPAGTRKVRLALEVESVVTAGNVGFDDCVQTLADGVVDASLLKNMENAPTTFLSTVEGFLGLADQNATLQHILDGLGSAVHPDGSVSNIDYATLFSLLQNSSQTGLTAALQAALNTVTLGNKTNKPASQGANPTSQASFDIGHFTNPATGAQTTTSLASGQAMAQRYTVPQDATYGFMEFQIACATPTNVFFNIYQIDPVTNVKTALFNSANSASLIPSAVDHVRIPLPGMPASLASDELLFEVVNGGTTALTVVSKTIGAPNNTNEVIQNVGFARATSAGGNSPTSLTSGQGSYSGTVPYAVIGIADVPADYHAPEPFPYTAAGTDTLDLSTLPWLTAGDLIDVIGIGGGQGGGSSLFAIPGGGGNAAAWLASTLVYGVDVKIGSTITIVVGDKGAAGMTAAGGSGGSTTVTYIDPSNTSHTITFAGGSGAGFLGGGSPAGQAAGTETYNGKSYFGGPAVAGGKPGQSPGGGGGGGVSYFNGFAGGVGECDIVCRQAA